MPKAGFWTIDPARKITFGKDGWWYADDERIQNRRINVLFSRHLQRTPEGEYEIAVGWDRVTVLIEDAPFVVTQVTGDPVHSLTLHLNDGREESLDPATLFVGREDVLYCRVKGGAYTARFLRPAYYQLTVYVQEDEESGGFHVRLNGTSYPIRHLS